MIEHFDDEQANIDQHWFGLDNARHNEPVHAEYMKVCVNGEEFYIKMEE